MISCVPDHSTTDFSLLVQNPLIFPPPPETPNPPQDAPPRRLSAEPLLEPGPEKTPVEPLAERADVLENLYESHAQAADRGQKPERLADIRVESVDERRRQTEKRDHFAPACAGFCAGAGTPA